MTDFDVLLDLDHNNFSFFSDFLSEAIIHTNLIPSQKDSLLMEAKNIAVSTIFWSFKKHGLVSRGGLRVSKGRSNT